MFVSAFVVPLVLLIWPTTGQHLTFPPVTDSGTSTSTTGSSTATGTATGTPTTNGTASAASTTSSPTGTSSAEFPSLSGYSSCVSNCLGLSVSEVGCNSLVDVNCFCANATKFTHSLVDCISSQCPTDLTNAETVSNQFCALASPNVSLSFPPATTTASPTANTSTTSSTPTSDTSTSSPPSPTQTNPTTGGALSLRTDSLVWRAYTAVGLGSAIAALALGL
ncbi:hypothetical protein EIP91_004875 [Steccherinum ochraceum]|uniref:CFEM domain-containing protein n=1 Tax=Steccherinum ochraceum TaxID=92696 RepID=A0A4R0R828_9APHY|nr:hypothetical protein EIP91_004875 [Steccherinum ochraceum]